MTQYIIEFRTINKYIVSMHADSKEVAAELLELYPFVALAPPSMETIIDSIEEFNPHAATDAKLWRQENPGE